MFFQRSKTFTVTYTEESQTKTRFLGDRILLSNFKPREPNRTPDTCLYSKEIPEHV